MEQGYKNQLPASHALCILCDKEEMLACDDHQIPLCGKHVKEHEKIGSLRMTKLYPAFQKWIEFNGRK